jgi:hypothetical protein
LCFGGDFKVLEALAKPSGPLIVKGLGSREHRQRHNTHGFEPDVNYTAELSSPA